MPKNIDETTVMITRVRINLTKGHNSWKKNHHIKSSCKMHMYTFVFNNNNKILRTIFKGQNSQKNYLIIVISW